MNEPVHPIAFDNRQCRPLIRERRGTHHPTRLSIVSYRLVSSRSWNSVSFMNWGGCLGRGAPWVLPVPGGRGANPADRRGEGGASPPPRKRGAPGGWGTMRGASPDKATDERTTRQSKQSICPPAPPSGLTLLHKCGGVSAPEGKKGLGGNRGDQCTCAPLPPQRRVQQRGVVERVHVVVT